MEGIREEEEPSPQELSDLAYFEGLLNEIIQRKRRIKRSTPDEERKVCFSILFRKVCISIFLGEDS